jgi:predicted nucleotidyltransferase
MLLHQILWKKETNPINNEEIHSINFRMMDKAINEVIDFLKQSLLKYGIKVDSIALFGSALNGNMDKDSDIDLIIISSDFENLDSFERAKLTMIPEVETLKKFKVSMDIINLSPEEYNKSNMKLFYNSQIVA